MDRLPHGFVPSGHGLALLVGVGPRGDDLGAQGPPPPLCGPYTRSQGELSAWAIGWSKELESEPRRQG